MIDFLQHLFEDGEIVVPRYSDAKPDAAAVHSLLIFTERIWRTDWPGTAPQFDVALATKAIDVLCLLCQATVYRELDEVLIAERLQTINLAPDDSAAAWYSVDLSLRFLPQIYKRLNRTSSDDPILQLALSIGQDWPLSSIGMPECGPKNHRKALGDAEIFRVYVDRVIAAEDEHRMNLPNVADAVHAALGPFENLRAKCALAAAQHSTADSG